MKFIKPILFVLAFVFSANTLFAQNMIADPSTWIFETKHVKDNHYQLIFHLKLKEGWHIWSLNPGGDGFQIVPSFKIKKNDAVIKLGSFKEKGNAITELMDGVDGKVTYFKSKVDYIAELEVNNNTTLSGTYTYQVCDDKMCLPPATKKCSFEIKDAKQLVATNAVQDTNTPVKSEASSTPSSKDVAQASQTITSTKEESKPIPSDQRSNLMLIIEGILGGLLSIITPCVFAMLPMTVSFFLKRSKDKKTGIKVALQYSFSIVLIFTLLGFLLTLVNNKNILYEFSSDWRTNLVFFGLFMIFAFSFLGAFELSLPSKWSTLTDSKANMNSFSGIFFMALTLAIVSFSCTAPFLGGLISEISKGAHIGPLFGFMGYGIGLALPFTLFAIFPQLLNALNKQGGWLNAVKVTFGFIELALAFKFLSNADLQKGWRLLDREIFIAIWVVIAIVLALYLLGKIRFSHDSDLPKNTWDLPYLTVTRTMFAIASLVFALYLLPGMWGAPLNGMGAFVPPMGTQDFVLNAGGSAAPEEKKEAHMYADKMKLYEPEAVRKFGLDTYFDYQEALAASKKLNKPLMLDFTGITCVNCRKMETQVWSNEAVLKMLKEDFIIVSLYCDATQVEIPKEAQFESQFLGATVETLGQFNSDLQATKYNSNTQPIYFFVDGNEQLLAKEGYSYNPDVALFIKHLNAVKAAYKNLHP